NGYAPDAYEDGGRDGLALKVIEFEQMLLPVCFMSVIGGTERFSDKQRSLFYQHYYPWAVPVDGGEDNAIFGKNGGALEETWLIAQKALMEVQALATLGVSAFSLWLLRHGRLSSVVHNWVLEAKESVIVLLLDPVKQLIVCHPDAVIRNEADEKQSTAQINF
ncbi:ubiquinone biosynthesis protein COQ4 homolog, mitochondrial-like protein, partial [Tanacetum coccineum]